MGKASSSKKVARAASIGGGRSAATAKPWVWWVALGLVALFGVGGILYSRADYRDEFAAGSSLVPPVANRDHWHAAYGVYLCDEFAPPIANQRDPRGIHTHADGVIHIHPFVRSSAGDNAVLSEFVDAVDMTLDDERLRNPGGKLYEEGKTECDGEPGIVQVKVNDEVITENVADIKPEDRDLITIAFAPRGAELPPPPSAPNLDNLSDMPGGSGTTIPSFPPPGGEDGQAGNNGESRGETTETETTAQSGTSDSDTSETTETTEAEPTTTSP